MSPDLLDRYLKVLREHGAMAATLEVPLDFEDAVHMCKVAVTFEPKMPEMMPTEVSGNMGEPGGWKSPQNLDLSQLDQEIE